jgi:ParB family transcriptional regulator, chromosome partitioning protein
MTEKKLGLGRGLSALLEEIGGTGNVKARGSEPAAANPAWTYIPTGSIRANPNQPRRHFDPEALAELSQSIRTHGMLQPVLVRDSGHGDYELVAGERRWRAAQAVPLHEVPAIIRRLDDAVAFEIALIENIQRAELNPIEEAEGYQRLTDEFGHTQDGIAKVTGKSRSHIANLVRLLKLPTPVLDLVRDGKLTMGHARALIGHPDAETLAAQVVAGGLSVRETETLVADQTGRERQSRPRAAPRTTGKDPDTEALERALSESIGLKVTIEGAGIAGRVRIDYASLDQLDMLAQRLSGGRF